MTTPPPAPDLLHQVRLLRLDGYSVADVARALNISYGRARRLLAKVKEEKG